MSFTNYTEGKIADEIFGATAFAAPATLHIGLHSAYPDETGAGAELTGGNYSRVAVTNNAANWPNYAANQKSNGATITFPTASGNWLEAVAVSIWDASSGGNMIARGWLGSDSGKLFTATLADLFTAPGHTLVNDDKVAVITVLGGTLPTGVVDGTIYFVVGVSGDTFNLSATLAGAAINITAAGAGLIKKVVPKTVQTNDTLIFGIGTVVIGLD
jgi:hypothetical protein